MKKTIEKAGEHMEKELRRCRSTLQILGAGVIGFALWDVAKFFLVLLMVSPETEGEETGTLDQLLNGDLPDEALIFILILFALFFLILIAGVLLRVRIGRAARAEGLGLPHRSYVGLAFVFFAFQILLFALAAWSAFYGGDASQTPLQIAATLILELCSLVTMGEVGFTALKVRKLSTLTAEAG